MENKQEKKSNKGLVIILILIILGLGGYLVYDKLITNNEVKKEKEEVKEEEVAYDLDKANDLIEKFYYEFWGKHNPYNNGYSDDYKFLVALNSLPESDFETTSCDKIYANIDEYGIVKETADGRRLWCREEHNIIKYDVINKKYKEMFGTDLEKDDFDMITYYDYDATIDSFSVLVPGMGYLQNIVNLYSATKATINGNILTVDVAYDEFEPNYENDDIRDGALSVNTQEKYPLNEAEVNEYINKYKDTLPHYRYTFEKVDDHFVFVNLIQVLS